MKYREIKPIGFLTNFIQSFWEYETFSTEFEHTIIPDGYFDLIVGFENNSFKQIKLTGVWIMPNRGDDEENAEQGQKKDDNTRHQSCPKEPLLVERTF